MSAFSFPDRTPDRMPAQAESLPREALVIILQLICRRQADINIGSDPTDPSCLDETTAMWVEECSARGLLVRCDRVMIRRISTRINILSISAVCRMASLSRAWCEAADCTFQGECFLLYKTIAPSPWHYIQARWATDCLLRLSLHSRCIDLLLLCRRRRR